MKEKSKHIEFRIVAPQAENVYLCGSFNHWSERSDPIKKDSTGTWKKSRCFQGEPMSINSSLTTIGHLIPIATPPNAIIYGSGLISIPQMARAGFIFNILMVFIITGMMYLLLGHVFNALSGN